MTVPRSDHTATLLPKGSVLITGGMSGNASFLASAELYDRSRGESVPAGNIHGTRGYGLTSTLLPTGKILIAGGYNGASCERSAEAARSYTIPVQIHFE